MLAAVTVLWGGGTLFFGGDSVSAADIDKAAVIKKVAAGTVLTDDEQKWFNTFFGGSTLRTINGGVSAGSVDIKYGNNGEPQIGESNRNVKGRVNGNGYLENSGIIYGLNNDFAGQSYVLGNDNIAMVNNNEEGVAIGYQNNMIANGGIGIGMFNKVLPTDHENEGYTSNGIAIGKQNLVHSTGIVVGQNAISSADASIAIGQQAIASGSLEAANAYTKALFTPGSFHYAEYLQKNFPNVFGKYDASQTEYQRMDTVDPILFEKYKWWFQKSNIDSYEKLIEQFGGGAGGEHSANAVMSNFGWKYALTQNNVAGATAVGFMAKAVNSYATAVGPDATASGQYSLAVGLSSVASGENGSAYGRGAKALGKDSLALGYLSSASDSAVALGSFAVVSAADLTDVDGTQGAFSGITLSTKGTEVKGINEYLLGPVAIGGKQSGNTSAVYLRQLKYVADGTADTDAVNLRQLKAAVGSSGNSGGGDNNGGSGNSGSSIVYEAGDNITITDGKNDHTKVISATGITDMKNQVTNLNGRVDKVEDSMNTMSHRITKLDRRVDKVGAGAAALAALHPLDFDPDNKWDIAGGYGHYAGQSAMALGAYYRPNEDVMFSIGGAFGNGEDMINAGVSVKVGSGESKTTTSKAAMAKKINELQDVVATQHQQLEEQKANMAKQDAKIAAQENEIKELKAIMQQILAK